MPRVDLKLYLNDDFDPITGKKPSRFRPAKRSQHAVLDDIAQHSSLQSLGADAAFNPTLGASRHEREWIFTYLGQLYESEYITDVLRRVKGGKEANVYVCQAHPSTQREFLAAKLYRPRMMRNLRNDARYRTNRTFLDSFGKVVQDGGELHAVRKGTSYGKELAHTSWLMHEFRTLQLLYDAGLPVPEPIASSDNTILMEYIGDLNQPAPNLTETTLTHKEAVRVRDLLIDSIDRMLAAGRIHADLSAYNVLYWDSRAVIIDFPQAISPFENPEALDIFQRDVLRICQYFERYGFKTHADQLSAQIWRKYQPVLTAADLEEIAALGLKDEE
jgi:RIO kinase 1